MGPAWRGVSRWCRLGRLRSTPRRPESAALGRGAAAASHGLWISCPLSGETATSEASVSSPHCRPGARALCAPPKPRACSGAVPAAPGSRQSDGLIPSRGPGGTSPLEAHRPHWSWDTAAFLILGPLPNEGGRYALCTVDRVDPHAHGLRSGPVSGGGATGLPPSVWGAPSPPSGTSTGGPHRGGDRPRGVGERRFPERQEPEALVFSKWHENVNQPKTASLCGACCGSVRVSGLFSRVLGKCHWNFDRTALSL